MSVDGASKKGYIPALRKICTTKEHADGLPRDLAIPLLRGCLDKINEIDKKTSYDVSPLRRSIEHDLVAKTNCHTSMTRAQPLSPTRVNRLMGGLSKCDSFETRSIPSIHVDSFTNEPIATYSELPKSVVSKKIYTVPGTNEGKRLDNHFMRHDCTSEECPFIKGSVCELISSCSPSDNLWDNIVGLDEAKILLRQVSDLPTIIPHLVPEISTGILLHGYPGTGKTSLVRALQAKTGWCMYNARASDLLEMYSGESEKKIRRLFKDAAHTSPSIVFIDEIDGICVNRNNCDNVHRRSILTTLLLELTDVLEGDSKNTIIFIGATNVPWDLDPALLRRLSTSILTPCLNFDSIVAMLKKEKFGTCDNCVDSKGAIDNFIGFSASDLKQATKKAKSIPLKAAIQRGKYCLQDGHYIVCCPEHNHKPQYTRIEDLPDPSNLILREACLCDLVSNVPSKRVDTGMFRYKEFC